MRELAAQSGVDVAVISRAERGLGNIPRASTIMKLATGLDLTDDEREELLLLAGYTPVSDESSLIQRIRDLEVRLDDLQARLGRLEDY